MDDIRFKNLYEAFCSNIEFSNYIENYGTTKVDLSKINYNLLMAIYSGFYLITVIDPLIEKSPNGDVKIKLIPEYLDEIVKKIAKPNGNGYTLGELSYKNSSVVLDKIRNKLAHGDFIMEDNSIIFEENNRKGVIQLDALLDMIMSMDSDIRFYKLEGKNRIINGNLKYVNDKKVHGDPSFKNFCKDLFIITIEDEPIPGHHRNLHYVDFVRKMNESIGEKFIKNEFNEKKIKQYIDLNQELLQLYGIKLTYKIQSIYDSEHYEMIKKNYKENHEYTQNLQGAILARYLLNRTLKLNNGQFQNFNYSKGISVSLFLMKILRDNPTLTLYDIPKKYPEVSFVLYADMDNAIISSILVGFYSFYQYGLEKGLTEKGNYDLAKLIQNKSLDFSKLDLTLLDDPNMIIEHKFLDYKNDIQKYQNKTSYLNARIEKCKYSLQMYLEHTQKENRNENRLQILENQLNDAILKNEENDQLIKNMELFMTDFNLKQYVKNINIIEHIRNAIAHGNIVVDEYNNIKDLTKKKIIIKDFLDGKICYQKELTISEFSSLFNFNNFNVLYYYLENNIENKNLIDSNYVSTINERILKKTHY